MKITKVRLQNIKSYLDQTVEFYDGVNLISGINGAGKSTLIESIGFALFDCKPGTTSEFLRYGTKSGVITVEFEANDGRVYRIVRKIGSTTSWIVYDAENETEIDLHGAADVKPWLKEILGVEADQELGQLFNDIVGVSQGTFTAPFLETPANRKQKFNKILKVEAYNEAYQKTAKVVTLIKDKISEQEKNLARLEERISDYDLIKTKTNEIKPLIASLQKELLQKEEQLQAKMSERDTLRALRVEIEKTEKIMEITKLEISNLKNSIDKLFRELEEAQQAAEKTALSKEGYFVYLAARKALEELGKKRLERDGIFKQLNELNTNINSLQAEISAEKKAINTQTTETEQTLKAKEAEYVAKADELKQLQNKVTEIEQLKLKFSNIKNQLMLAEKQTTELFNIKSRLHEGLEKWTALKTEMHNTEELLAKESVIKKEAEELKQLENELTQTHIKLAAYQQKLKTLQENCKQTSDGLCPFLDSPCQNVEGDLKKYFATRITEAEKEIQLSTTQVDQLKKDIDCKRPSLEALNNLDLEHKNLIRLNVEQERFIKRFKELFSMSLHYTFTEAFKAILNESSELHKVLVGFTQDLDNTLLHRAERKQEELKILFETYKELLSVSLNQLSPENLQELLTIFIKVEEAIALYLEILSDMSNALSEALNIEADRRSVCLSTVSAGKQLLSNQIIELKHKHERLQKQLDALSIKESKVVKLKAGKDEADKKLAAIGDVDTELTVKQQQLDSNQNFYDTYIKYQDKASKILVYKEQVEKEKSIYNLKEASFVELKANLAEFTEKFDQQKLKDVESIVESFQIELATHRQVLKERNSVLAELNQKLETMERTKGEIANTVERIARHNDIKTTIEFIRGVFNKAGERVAGVYREYLAHEANRLYRDVAKESVELEWRNDYEVVLIDSLQGRKRERSFKQLSGGEQMTAALAVRLALLGQISGVKIGFFDEPTTNLDGERRNNLAQIIPAITGDFEQLFVISHDDSFDSMTDNVIQLKKDAGEGTKLR